MRQASLPANGRLGVVARFGVGYDSVDVEALADAGVATTITPGGVQRPVAVAILASDPRTFKQAIWQRIGWHAAASMALPIPRPRLERA